jgi:hypothetical protein
MALNKGRDMDKETDSNLSLPVVLKFTLFSDTLVNVRGVCAAKHVGLNSIKRV